MKKNIRFKKISAIFFMTLLILPAYVLIEPTEAEALTATDTVVVTMTVDPGITISDGANVTMAPNLGITSNSAIGSSAWTVTTNNNLGYTLAVKASAAPALVSGGNSFADYTETVADTPEVWSVGTGAKEFGYSAYGTDTSTTTWGTAASCGAAGVPAAAEKYQGFSISDRTIATRAAVTPVAGITTTICFAAQQNAIYAATGIYTATITATATTL